MTTASSLGLKARFRARVVYHKTHTIQAVFDPQQLSALGSTLEKGGRPHFYDRYCRMGQYRKASWCKEETYTKLQILLIRKIKKLTILLMLNTRHEPVSTSVLVRVICH